MSELPAGWAMATLADVADWGSGGTPRAGDPRYYGGPVPWAIIGDLTDGLVFQTESSLTEQGLDESSAKLVEPGTILVAMYGSIGKLGIAGVRMATNQAIAFARARDGFEAKYLFWFLSRARNDLSAAGKGATQRNISQTILRSWPMPVAPIAEQRRIVAAIEEQFSRLDAAERSLASARRRLGTLQTAIVALATAGYSPVELGDLVVGLRYGTSIKCSYEADGLPVVRIPNVQGGKVDLSDLKFAADPGADLSAFILAQGDLLIVRTNGSRDLIGRVAAVDRAEGLAFASYLIRARPDRSRLDPKFAAMALSSPTSRALIEARAATTAGQYNLNVPALKSLPIPLPPIHEQRLVVAEVERQLSIVEALRAKIRAARRRSAALRRSILEQAFSGSLVPHDPVDEPASVLLDRIAAERASAPRVPRRRPKVSA